MNLLNAYLRSPRVQRALSKKTKNAGFTLIELVIVVAILAILAAIGIPAFNDAQIRAREAAAKTGLATAYKECKVSELIGDAAFTKLVDGGGVDYDANAGAGLCDVIITGNSQGGRGFTIDLRDGAKATTVNGSGLPANAKAWD